MKKHENSTVVDECTLEMVLEDKVPSPFSLQDFISYLNQTYCTENLAFYLAVTEYRTTSQFFFGSTVVTGIGPASVRLMNGQFFTFQKDQYHLLAPQEKSFFDNMMQQFDTIIDQFIQINANQEINIPADMKQQLLINAQHGCYHPALLAPAYMSILELLRISAFLPFITDPQRLAIFTSYTSNTATASAFSLPPLSFSSSNITFASTLSSSTSTTSISSSSSLASVSCPTVSRPAYFSRSSSQPTQPPPPQAPPLHPHPRTLRRLKSSPSLNTITPDAPPPPLPSLHPSISCRSSSTDRPRSTHTITDDNDNDDKPFLKKWASSLLRFPSPQHARPIGGWRQITVHDSPLFKQSSCLAPPPSRPSS